MPCLLLYAHPTPAWKLRFMRLFRRNRGVPRAVLFVRCTVSTEKVLFKVLHILYNGC